MKVKILKKSIKEGTTSGGMDYKIKSLFVSFTEIEIYNRIVAHLKATGCTQEQIDKFIRPNEYKGEISYAFGVNPSSYTFDRVDRFGILDANFVFSQNDKGFIGAKIQVIDKKEQINGYEAPDQQEEEVTGWNVAAPEVKQTVPIDTLQVHESALGIPEPQPFSTSLEPQVGDLPF
jgi:hypothetical protein